MKIAVPDLISNSYFPTVAAVDLGCFAEEALDVALELIFPVDTAYRALRDGEVDFVGGSAHSALAAFPNWAGVKLLCAQAQGMYWFLVMRADLNVKRGDLAVLRGRKIGAAPWVEMGLRRLLAAAGVDIDKDDIDIGPVPGAKPVPGQVVNFGVTAALALAQGKIDGFWANGMGAAVAVAEGIGSILLDVRRGDGPAEAFNYTMASVATTDQLIREEPGVAAAAIRAIKRVHRMLHEDVGLATQVAAKRFPKRETELIAELIRRDLPYYDLTISPDFVRGMSRFTRDLGLTGGEPSYEDVVATRFSSLWTK
jgi:NitT/TauT family transport system substrate-binding protein